MLAEMRSVSAVAKASMCRAGVAMLYAHWEGYFRHALSQYLRFVARRKLRLSELEDCFAAMALELELSRAQGLSVVGRSVMRVTLMRSSVESRLMIPSRDGVDTQSNLSSEVTHDLLVSVGLDPSPFAIKARLIDYSLLRARNRIAHGEWEAPDPTTYMDLHSEVLTLMTLIRNLVVDAAENTKYRRPEGGGAAG